MNQAGGVQFSGLGITFKGFACQATLSVIVFISFSGAFMASMKMPSVGMSSLARLAS